MSASTSEPASKQGSTKPDAPASSTPSARSTPRGGTKKTFTFYDAGLESERVKMAYTWKPSWRSDTVLVSVGRPHVNFSVHASVLIAPLFKTALEGPWAEASTGKVVLPTIEPETFEAYMPWMYARAVWDVELDVKGAEDWLSLCKSYVLADYIRDLDYRGQVVRQLLLLALHSRGDVPDPACVKWVYSQTEDGSPLRKLLRDACVETWDAMGTTTKKTFIDYPHDFVADMASRALNLLRTTSTKRSLGTTDYIK